MTKVQSGWDCPSCLPGVVSPALNHRLATLLEKWHLMDLTTPLHFLIESDLYHILVVETKPLIHSWMFTTNFHVYTGQWQTDYRCKTFCPPQELCHRTGFVKLLQLSLLSGKHMFLKHVKILQHIYISQIY